MIKIKTLLVLILLSVVCYGFFGCKNSDEDSQNEEFIGTRNYMFVMAGIIMDMEQVSFVE